MIEIVFFDAGETLLHPYPSFRELFADVCLKAGREVSVEAIGEVQQRLAPHLVELASESGIEKPSLDPDDSFRFWTHLYRRLLAELGIQDEALVTRLYETFSSTASYRLFNDSLQTLQILKEQGYRLGLISNFEGWLEEMLVELEVGHIFDVSVISGLVGIEKPDPGIYRHAIELASVDAARAAHIGDSPAMDAEPAAAVGMKPILLDRYRRYEGTEWPRVESLLEVPRMLARMNGAGTA